MVSEFMGSCVACGQAAHLKIGQLYVIYSLLTFLQGEIDTLPQANAR